MKSKPKSDLAPLPDLKVIIGHCLGYKAYRGFAPLWLLAEISKADIFDQENNPNGTQRNLSRTHARKAYEYVSTRELAFFPEIIVNVRDKSYVEVSEDKDGCGKLIFTKDPRQTNRKVISRLDGNHRLYFADGHEKNLPAIDRSVAYCLLMVPDLNRELELFRDINDNQMGMNTSHLQNITARLLGDKSLKVTDPPLYIVRKLHEDSESPFYNRINQGGAIQRGVSLGKLNTANLKNAVQDMLGRSNKLSQFPNADAQYELVKNFWSAVKLWLPDAWENPSEYIIFKGAGLYAITYVGIEIIDRCLLKGKYTTNDMLDYLKKIQNVESLSSKKGIPFAGRGGGRKIAADLISEIEEEGEVSLNTLQKLILSGSDKRK